MRIFITVLLMTCLCFSFTPLMAQKDKKNNFFFMAFGDMPYFLPQDYSKFEQFIQKTNEEKPAFSINVGDFKSSSTLCSDEAFAKMHTYFSQFDQPLIYTPGDNEWTDCFKMDAGSYDPEERLTSIRKLFFQDSMSFGKQKIKLKSQANSIPFTKYVENKLWVYEDISFATVHIVGSNNNFIPTSKNGNSEFYDRETADLAWLDEVFKNARLKNHKAIVIIEHADMFYNAKNYSIESGFNTIKTKLYQLSVEFKKPVLLIHGDSHFFLIDKPFSEGKEWEKSLRNFTRIQVPGEHNMSGVKIHVNLESPSIFQFEEFIPKLE